MHKNSPGMVCGMPELFLGLACAAGKNVLYCKEIFSDDIASLFCFQYTASARAEKSPYHPFPGVN